MIESAPGALAGRLHESQRLSTGLDSSTATSSLTGGRSTGMMFSGASGGTVTVPVHRTFSVTVFEPARLKVLVT